MSTPCLKQAKVIAWEIVTTDVLIINCVCPISKSKSRNKWVPFPPCALKQGTLSFLLHLWTEM